MSITSSWDIQKALLAGHSGASRDRLAAPSMPTLDDVTERCPHCQKMARYETYQSRRDGQLYHVELIRCSAKDCKHTTKTETLIGEDMPIIPQAVRDRYKIARNRLKMTDAEASQKLGLQSRNSLSSMLCHGSANEERIADFTRLVEEMEAKAHLLDQADGIVQVEHLTESERPGTVSGPEKVASRPEPETEIRTYKEDRGPLIPLALTQLAISLESRSPKMDLINEAVSIIRRIPVQFRELLLDLARHEDAADQARTVLERNLNA